MQCRHSVFKMFLCFLVSFFILEGCHTIQKNESFKEDPLKSENKTLSTCFLSSFNPELGRTYETQCLNIEEVFKNYQYFEVTPHQDMIKITVKKVVQGQISYQKNYRFEFGKFIEE